jgi:hypothetical protein
MGSVGQALPLADHLAGRNACPQFAYDCGTRIAHPRLCSGGLPRAVVSRRRMTAEGHSISALIERRYRIRGLERRPELVEPDAPTNLKDEVELVPPCGARRAETRLDNDRHSCRTSASACRSRGRLATDESVQLAEEDDGAGAARARRASRCGHPVRRRAPTNQCLPYNLDPVSHR